MFAISTRLKTFLDDKGVRYEPMHHRSDFTAQETAADTHTPGHEFAKTVLLRVDERTIMVVLPANHRVDFAMIHEIFGAKHIRLCTEDEMRQLFPDCDLGAEPPFGNLYGIPVYLSDAMRTNAFLTFNAGSHEDVVRLRFHDYLRLAEPVVIRCSRATAMGQ